MKKVMKRRFIRSLCCLMTIALVFSLAACAGGEEQQGTPGTSGTAGKTGTQETPGERGYILTHYTALPDSVTGVTRCALDGDRLILCCREEADGDRELSYAAAMSLDGGGFEKLPLALKDSEQILDLTPDGQGGLWCACMTPAEEDGVSVSLCRFDSGGSRTVETPLDGLLEEKGALAPYIASHVPFYASCWLAADGDGNLCFAVFNGQTICFMFDPEGAPLFSFQSEGRPKAVIKTASGQLAVCSSTDGDWTYSVYPLDMEKHALGEGTDLGTTAMVYGGTGNTDMYLYDTAGFYRCGLGTGAEEKLFDWSELGLASGDAHVCPLPDGRFAVVAGTNSQTQLLSYEFCIAEPGEDTRTVLTMLSMQPDDSVLEAVARFNKSSGEYKVELTSCFSASQDVSQEEWDTAVTRLNTELIAGHVPDIMDLNGLPGDAYSRRGFLEDLWPYIENDPEIRLEDYYGNVLTALSVDGKLPYVTSNVQVYTMLTGPDVERTGEGWTVEEFVSLMESGDVQMRFLPPSQLLQAAVVADGGFVDWATGTAAFDSKEFTDLLELCKKQALLSVGKTDDEGNFIGQENCVTVTLFSFFQVAEYNRLFGGGARAAGLPTTGGEAAHFLKPANLIGLSAACPHKDGAWAFVRSFLEPGMQESGRYLPFYKPSLEKLAEEAVKGNSMWANGMFRAEITQADIELVRELLGAARYCDNSDRELMDIIGDMANAYFMLDKSAEEAAEAIQSRATLYLGERM